MHSRIRSNLATLLDEVTLNQETVIIKRRGKEGVAFISASELSSLQETAHLLCSPKNAVRLLKALLRAKSGEEQPLSMQELKKEAGVGQ